MRDSSHKRNQKTLETEALLGLVRKFALECLLLFVLSWTLVYWEAWVYLAINYLTLLPIVIYFLNHDPEFVRRRLKITTEAETRKSQKIIMGLLKWLYILILVVPALDHRFGWSRISPTPIITADVAILVGMAIQFRVFQENSFASAVIELAADQKVISTGPYRLVRHPMYTGATVVSFATSVALGSWWGLPVAGVKLIVIVARLLDEEKFLAESLPGYREYCREVKCRLIPYVW
jgi:protein-S-isoprenylcysteine O-methyltransferase Ste14